MYGTSKKNTVRKIDDTRNKAEFLCEQNENVFFPKDFEKQKKGVDYDVFSQRKKKRLFLRSPKKEEPFFQKVSLDRKENSERNFFETLETPKNGSNFVEASKTHWFEVCLF